MQTKEVTYVVLILSNEQKKHLLSFPYTMIFNVFYRYQVQEKSKIFTRKKKSK